MSESLHAPVAARQPVRREFHGDVVIDDYEWLREKSDPKVIAHLEAENAWTQQCTEHLAGLREELFGDISARTQQTDLAVPALVVHSAGDAWWYYSRTVEGYDYAIRCRVPATSDVRPDLEQVRDQEQVLLDGNAEAEGHEFFALGVFSVSPDGQRLLWSVDSEGDERYRVLVRDLASGTDHEVVSGAAAGGCWAGDANVIYTRVDDTWRPFQLWRHRLDGAAADSLVLTEPDERFWLGAAESAQRTHLVIQAGSKLTSECWLLANDDLDSSPRSVAGRQDGIEYQVEVAGDRLLVVHNANAADFELAEAPLDATSRDQWRTVVPPREGVRLDSLEAHQRFVVLEGRAEGLTMVEICSRDENGDLAAPRRVQFDEPVRTVETISEQVWDASSIRVAYSSLVTPPTVLEVDLASGSSKVLKSTPVLDHPVRGAYDPSDYVQERLWATAGDGTRVPISLVHHKDVRPDGTNPGLVYGYGSYEISTDPTFRVARLSMLERGMVFALAHVRGGGEMGRAWYEGGSQLTKRNTFTDFVSCAEHLVESGWVAPGRLAAEGGSAGGLLMGAVTNLAPERFCAVHAIVPFVDALTSILKPELPLTAVEWEEWGNPIESREVYEYMKSYTPYENVRECEYPSILATTSLNDTRVLFTEPAKWVAMLRERTCNGPERPILLHTEMSAGHGGASGRYESWRERAFEMAWLMDRLGMA